jgi:hypothetical protein
MKPRARRITITAAVLGAAVVAVLVVAHWDAVRDHLEAWRFQLARETKMIQPDPEMKEIHVALDASLPALGGQSEITGRPCWPSDMLRILANRSGCRVISSVDRDTPDIQVMLGVRIANATSGVARTLLELSGYRVIEQCFPQRAFVVIPDYQEGYVAKRPDEPSGVLILVGELNGCE